MEKDKKSATRRHQERGKAKIDPRKTVLDILQRSGRMVEVGELRTADVKWMSKPGIHNTQVYGYELDEPKDGEERKYRKFPDQGEPPHVYPMVTLRYTPRPGTIHRCVLVTLPSSLVDKKSGERIEIMISYALPVDRRPLYRTGEWNDDAMSTVTVQNFWPSDRPGIYAYAPGPNRKGVVIRDKSFVPPHGECKVVVIEGLNSFTALCLDVDLRQAAPDGSEMKSGDLALAGDAMRTRLTDDPWFYAYDGHLYEVAEVLGGDLSSESTMDELRARFAELSKSDNPTAQARKFKREFSIAPSKADKDAFDREWGLIVACYKQMEMNLLRRDMDAKHKPAGEAKFKFAMVHVPLTTLAATLRVDVVEVRQLLTEIGLPIPASVTQVAKPFAETVCGYYITEKNPAATPTQPILIVKPQAVVKPTGKSVSDKNIRVDLDALKLAMGMKIKVDGRSADDLIAELKIKVEQGWTINGADGQLALEHLFKTNSTEDNGVTEEEVAEAEEAGQEEDEVPTVRARANGKPGIKGQRSITPKSGTKTAASATEQATPATTEAKPATTPETKPAESTETAAPVVAKKKPAPRKKAAAKTKPVADSATK